MIAIVKCENDIRNTIKDLEKKRNATPFRLYSEKKYWQGWIDALLWILDEENTAPKGELK